jgi:hypothetical protein
MKLAVGEELSIGWMVAADAALGENRNVGLGQS